MRFRKSAPRASSPCLRAPKGGRGWAALGGLLVVLLIVPRLGAAAAIEGKVTLPPVRTAAPVQRNRYDILSSSPKAADDRNELSIVVRRGVAAPNPPVAVVYLEREGGVPRPARPPLARMEQRDQKFVPALLVVQVGTNVEFPNLDQGLHSVFTRTSLKPFDLGRYRPNETPPAQLLDQPGLWTMRCDIHDNMVGLVLVVPTPYFVQTDREGRFRLPDLPPGRYTLSVWKSSDTTLSVPVTVPAEGTVKVDFP